ncbi:reverse transcriptase [Ancylostoma ceylanicum]|uniref:Reverse transcriptase n=1 Tax=Ancylostoma ceylanicum TaxID=53326 RepID=A0A0D6LCH8_9BILA|nr:reverse transcriptase [Ancylostoma ceylanicum]
MSDEGRNNRWTEHFRDILNQPNPPQTYNFDDEREAIGAVDELDVNTGDISVEETEDAIRSLKNKKAPGLDEIPAEILKAGGRSMAEQLTRLCNDCWRQAKIPEDWRKGKAFDCIHRESLWAILSMCGIPQVIVNVFRSLYHNSCCCVKTNTGHTGFKITTGVRQGCILSPVLFNTALDFVMRKAIKSGEAGVSWNNHGRLTDLDYADDIALLAESDSKLQEATSSLNQEATKVGLRISAEKSKVMKIGIEHTPININVGTTQLENFTNFTYLGSTVSYDGDADSDIRTRITKAAAFWFRRPSMPVRRGRCLPAPSRR